MLFRRVIHSGLPATACSAEILHHFRTMPDRQQYLAAFGFADPPESVFHPHINRHALKTLRPIPAIHRTLPAG